VHYNELYVKKKKTQICQSFLFFFLSQNTILRTLHVPLRLILFNVSYIRVILRFTGKHLFYDADLKR